MRKICQTLYICVCLLLVTGGYGYAEVTRFFNAFQDIPLMPGLTELSDQSVVFDKPGGRIAESLADTGGQEQHVVIAYYQKALPQFGWVPSGANRFVRDQEALSFDFESLEGRSVIRLTIEPL